MIDIEEIDPKDIGAWGALTPSTQRLNDLVGSNLASRRLTLSEIELLRQSKKEMAKRFPANYARHVPG